MKTPDQLARSLLAPETSLGIRLRCCCAPPLVEDVILAVASLLHEVIKEKEEGTKDLLEEKHAAEYFQAMQQDSGRE